ncbi:MAG: 23S rRNA (adenine(2503)-C(2))-methyltransferase RlmN, partial [Bacteroidales bacterium]
MNDIRKITQAELNEFIISCGEKKFRTKQIEEWLWKKGVGSFEEMKNIPLTLKEILNRNFSFHKATIAMEAKSVDKTVKFGFQLFDDKLVEGVLIPTEKRVTACVSTQVGCAMQCAFCATGTMGFFRNLHFSEIFDQYILMNQKAVEYFDI